MLWVRQNAELKGFFIAPKSHRFEGLENPLLIPNVSVDWLIGYWFAEGAKVNEKIRMITKVGNYPKKARNTFLLG